MKINYDKLMELYNLKNLSRFNLNSRIKEETVAEHSYYVSLFTLMICEDLNLSPATTLETVKLALIHDIPEIELSDIPHSVKASCEEINELMSEREIIVLEKILSYGYWFRRIKYDQDTFLERTIVHFADVISVLQFVEHEKRLGNSTLKKIEYETLIRYEEVQSLIQNICGYRISCFETIGKDEF